MDERDYKTLMKPLERNLTLKEYQEKYGIKRIDFSKLHDSWVNKWAAHCSDKLCCPECGEEIEYEAEEISSILEGTKWQCPYCDKWFYASGETQVNTTCETMEAAVMEKRKYIEETYAQNDLLDKRGWRWDSTRHGVTEWEVYKEYAEPLFANMKKGELG